MKKVYITIVITLISIICSKAQTILTEQSFESVTTDTWGYTETPAFGTFTDADDVWDVVSTLQDVSSMPTDGSNFVGAVDIDNVDNPNDGFADLTFDDVDITGETNVQISFDYEVFEFDNGDEIVYEVFIDGTGQGEVVLVDGESDLSASGTVAIAIPNGSSTVSMIITINQNGQSDAAGVDNFQVASGVVPSCSIINSGLANIVCNDNGTPEDPADDFVTFDLNPTGNTLGTEYLVSVSSGSITPTTATYGSATTFTLQGGTAGAGDVNITISDDTDGSCTLDETITDPGVCSILPAGCAAGASVIVIEDFDGTTPTWNNDIAEQTFVDPSSPDEGLFIQAASTDNPNFSGNTAFGRDLEGETGEPGFQNYVFTFDNVDLSGFENISLSFDYAVKANVDIGSYVTIIDGFEETAVEFYNDPENGEFGKITLPIPDGTSTLGLRIEGTLNGSSDSLELDNFYVCGVVILPIKLAYFVGEEENRTVNLEWKTLSEINNDYFELLHSTNGLDFAVIHTEDGFGTTVEPQTYYYTDEHPNPGVNYYKLVQYDLDGSRTEEGDIVQVNVPLDEELKIITSATELVLIVPKEGLGNITIFNMNGRAVVHTQEQLIAGENSFLLPTELTKGLYIIQLTLNGQQTTKKLMIQ